jgi:hypothetical protein
MFAAGVVGFFVLAAVLTRSSAPAVTVSALGGLLAGAITFFVAASNGPHGVPLSVGAGVSVGVVVGAVAGVALTRRRAPGMWPMHRWALGLLVATPLLVGVLVVTALDACPLYQEGRRAGFCHNDVDLLGDWISGVAVAFAGVLLVWVVLLWVAPGRVVQEPRPDDEPLPPGAQAKAADDRRPRTIATTVAIALGLIALAAWSFPPVPDVVGMSPKRAALLLSEAGFDLESSYPNEAPEDAPLTCEDVPRQAGEPPAEGADTCVLVVDPKLGFFGRAARGTALVLYVGGPDER